MKKLITLALGCLFSVALFSQIPASQPPQLYPGSAYLSIDNDIQHLNFSGQAYLRATAWVDYLGTPSIMVALQPQSGPAVMFNVTAATGVYDRFVDVALTENQRYVILMSHSLSGALNRTVIPISFSGGVYSFGAPVTQLVTNTMVSFSGVETDRSNIYAMYIDNSGINLHMFVNYNANLPTVSPLWANTVLTGGATNFHFTRFAVSSLSTNTNDKVIRYMLANNSNVFCFGIELIQTSPTTYTSTVQWGTLVSLPTAPSFTSSSYAYYYGLDISAPIIYNNSGGILNNQYVASIASNAGDVYVYSPSSGAFNLLMMPFGPSAPGSPVPSGFTGKAVELIYSNTCGAKYYLAVSNQFVVGAPATTVQLDLNANPILQYMYIDNQVPAQKIHASIAVDNGYIGLGALWNGIPGTKLSKCSVGASWIKKNDNEDEVSTNTPRLQQNGFTVYPNPAINDINIESKDREIINRVVIYDLTGKVVYQQDKLEVPKVTVNTLDWSSGFYFVKINDAELIKIVK